MAPVPITEDYYLILEVVQTATPEQITRSYKRFTLKLHPDQNAKRDATEVSQKLGRAYETLKDESTRRTYDIIYILIKQKRPATHDTKAPRSHPASEALSEAAQIAALKKSKQERAMRRQIKKTTFELEVTKKQKTVQQLNKEIENLKSITAAELAADTFENSW